jgi:hypothetical protein
VAPFSGIRRFPQGRGFKQWTGDDSKALMKVRCCSLNPALLVHRKSKALKVLIQVYLPAIEGYVPNEMLRCLRAFLEFCYIARRDIISETSLNQLKDALARFHHYRQVFNEIGVDPGLTFPRQHSMMHYVDNIRLFGAPNGLCSSITEAKHIKAVKEPWRRTNRYQPLYQILCIIQRLDKLAAMRRDFTDRKMMEPEGLRAALALIGTLPVRFLSKVFNRKTISESMRLETEASLDALVSGSGEVEEDSDDEDAEALDDLTPSIVKLARRTRKYVHLIL